MLFVAVVFVYLGAFLCCFSSCSSGSRCNMQCDNGKKVYAFPSHIMRDLDSTNHAYVLRCKVDIPLNKSKQNCMKKLHYKLRVSYDNLTQFDVQNVSENYRTPEEAQFDQIHFEVYAGSILKSIGHQKFTSLELLFLSNYTACNKSLFDSSCSCSTTKHFKVDHAPNISFATTLNTESPRDQMTDNDNEASSNLVVHEIDKTDDNVYVQISVTDNDLFVDNPFDYDYSQVGDPIITLTAYVTLFKYLKSIKVPTPYILLLATNKGLNKAENAWWKNSISKGQKNAVKLHFEFAVSPLSSAINDLLSSSNTSGNSSLVSVHLTLGITAKSGITNPQQRTSTLSLVLLFKRQWLFAVGTANIDKEQSANEETSTGKDLLTVRTAHGGTATTANEEDVVSSLNGLAVICGATLSVAVLLIVIKCQTALGRN